MADAQRKPEPQNRAKYLPQGYLYNTASDLRRTAARLMKDADAADEDQAKLMRREAVRLLKSAKRFDRQADVSPSDADGELPFR